MSQLMRPVITQLRTNVKSLSSGLVKADPKVVESIKARQQAFQSSDEPVYMKAGKNHFYLTTAVGAAALVCTAYSYYNLVK